MAKEIALTFDDGPWPGTTSRILDLLIEERIPATFMIWGEHAQSYPEILKRAAEAGLFAFGNHTFSHRSLLELSEAEILEELEKTDRRIQEITGKRPEFIRPPFGDADRATLEIVKRPLICWSLDTESWRHQDPALCLEAIKQAKDGDIVLMHDFQAAEAEALAEILKKLQAEDFVFRTIPELLGNQLLEEPYFYYSRDARDKIGKM